MPKPACIKCQRFFRPKQNGYVLTEMMPKRDYYLSPPGTAEPEQWTPYKIWRCDLYECEGCGHQIAVGYGQGSVSEHYMDDFEEELQHSQSVVNDC